MDTSHALMHARCRWGVLALAVLLTGPGSIASDAAIALDVRPSIVFVGSDIRAVVRTPRDPHNRALRIVLEAADFYASSDLQLDGAAAPAVHQFDWKTLPGGSYLLQAILIRDAGDEHRAQRCVSVLSHEHDDRPGEARSRVPSNGAAADGC